MSRTAFRAEVVLPHPPAVVFAYLSDPRHRPEWQSSLLSVDVPAAEPGVGLEWTERTIVGVRPRLRVTLREPPTAWAETGTWRGVSATLRLDLTARPEGRTRVLATGEVAGTGAWLLPARVAGRLAGRAIAADLRKAGRALTRRGSPN